VNAFISEQRARCGACKALQVTPSAYLRHAARQRNPAQLPARARRDASLLPQVQHVCDQNLRVYGADNAWRQLRREGGDGDRWINETTPPDLIEPVGLGFGQPRVLEELSAARTGSRRTASSLSLVTAVHPASHACGGWL
jgi:hypothetical protein